MRIIAGTWRGRRLTAPAGEATRPTSERMRKTLFDMLAHAEWAHGALAGSHVLDAFAGTGALGLEALSRGAARAHFIERDRAALGALRANVAACRAETVSQVIPGDALRPRPGAPCGLVFLDPPYGQDLVPRAVAALALAGWLAPGALLVAETGSIEALSLPATAVADRTQGAARLSIWKI